MSVRFVIRTAVFASMLVPPLAEAQARAKASRDSTPPSDSTSPIEKLTNDLPVPIRLHIGGLFQILDRAFIGDVAHAYTDEIVLRRARLDLTGTVANHFDFRFLPDFGLGGAVTIQDFWINVHYFDAAQLQVGKFKEPVGYELLEHDQYMLFVERSLVSDLVPNRDVGAAIHGDFKKGVLTYSVGVFDGVPDGGSADRGIGDDKDFSGRIFVRPFATTGIAALSEFGFGGGGTIGQHQGSDATPNLATYKASDQQINFFSYIANPAKGDTAYSNGKISRGSAAASWYVNRLGLISEYAASWQAIARSTGVSATIHNVAWQTAGELSLTNDHPTYTGVTPRHPFDPAHGAWGALALTGRYTLLHIDPTAFTDGFADPTKSARRASAFAEGIDWYLNRAFRFEVNYERTFFLDGAKVGNHEPQNALLTEVQLSF